MFFRLWTHQNHYKHSSWFEQTKRIRVSYKSNSANRFPWVADAEDSQSISVLSILENIKDTRLKFSQGSIAVSWKMPNYEEVGVKLTNTQLYKLKFAAKTKIGTTLRKTRKKFQDKELPH